MNGTNYSLYILYSAKIDQYYVGISNDPENRLFYHNLGLKGWTKRGIPWELVFTKSYTSKEAAGKAECYIKSQKSKTFIRKIIQGEYVLPDQY
ncbi:MAG: GIY-YIG nuclease family protein [Candidatus Marinimicrobia bacterium]|nr:GIY-YIG nuclease family protein [Candidatus Neomarinimicrobiota bacterium]